MKPKLSDVLSLAATAVSLLGGASPLGCAGAVVAVAAILAWLLAQYECVDLFRVRLRRRQETHAETKKPRRSKGGAGAE